MFELGSKFLSIMFETWGQISNYSDLVQGMPCIQELEKSEYTRNVQMGPFSWE